MKNKEMSVAWIKHQIMGGATVRAKLSPYQQEELRYIAKLTPSRDKIFLDFPKNFVLPKKAPAFLAELYKLKKRDHKKYVYRRALNSEQRRICKENGLPYSHIEFDITALKIEARKTAKIKKDKKNKK